MSVIMSVVNVPKSPPRADISVRQRRTGERIVPERRSHRTMRRLGYVASLDGLRGVAIAGVVSYHAFGWPLGGWTGVHLFFVLSGFLITTLLLEEHAAAGRIGLRAF